MTEMERILTRFKVGERHVSERHVRRECAAVLARLAFFIISLPLGCRFSNLLWAARQLLVSKHMLRLTNPMDA